MAVVKVYNMNKEDVGELNLNDAVFNAEYNEPAIHQVVVAIHNNNRQGTMSTLTRSEVNLTRKKMYRQKGTGSARHHAQSAPQFVGGGVVFAKKPRDFSQKVNKKVRDIALASALSEKLRQGELFVVDSIKVDAPKTKVIADMLEKFDMNKKTVIITAENDTNVVLSSRNIEKLSISEVNLMNVCDIVENKFVMFTKDAIKKLEEAYV